MLNPRSIAVGGIGFGALAGATLGFIVSVVEPPVVVTPEVSINTTASGGGHYDAGQGYIQTQHGWVKATKIAKFGAQAFDVSIQGSSAAKLGSSRFAAHAGQVSIAAKSSVVSYSEKFTASDEIATCRATSVTSSDETLQSAAFASHDAKIEWLSLDELLVILEEV